MFAQVCHRLSVALQAMVSIGVAVAVAAPLGSRLLAGTAEAAEAVDKQRPNVIIVITDDQGYGDLSCHGNPVLRTPNLDRLHAQSVRLTDFHVSPVCTPTRGQLMTGQDALRNGARMVPAGMNMIRRDVPTMPELFAAAGYSTGLFGKWHLGDHYPDRPLDRGFQKAVWFLGWGVSSAIEFDNDCEVIRYLDGTQQKISDRYCTDLWFQEAISWMDVQRQQGKPFLCYIATNAPHSPLWVPERYVEPYQDKVPRQVAQFYAMIANIDENVGRLLKWVEDVGIWRQTIVIFLTDNGTAGGRKVYDAGMRMAKGSYYEGGHRVPCFICWPGGGLGQPRDVSVPTQVQDLLPTLLDLCQIKPKPEPALDGISLAKVLTDPSAKLADRMLVVQYGGRVLPKKYESCVIWGKWRLVMGKELYDIQTDPAQQKDLAAEHPQVVARMRDHYEQWWRQREQWIFQYQPIVVGAEQENPVILDPNYWAGVDVDNYWRVAQAAGGPRGGPWHIVAKRPGRYRVELRRWPFHTNHALGSTGPKKTIFGRPLELKKLLALQPAEAVLQIGARQFTAPASPKDLGVVFQVTLPAERTTMQGWFRDADGNDLCGAYYARVQYDGPATPAEDTR